MADSNTNNSDEEYSQKWWLTEISSSEKWLDEEFRTTGDRVVERYLDKRSGTGDKSDVDESSQRKYNIFWANVQIIKSALYATPPKPVVKRAHDDAADDVARVAALILERMLMKDLGADDGDMHHAFQQSVEDRLIPGLGQVWLRYEADVTKDEKGEPQQINYECVHTEYVNWRDFLYPQIRVWNEKWWLGRRVWMKKKAFIAKWGKEVYNDLKKNFDNTNRSDPMTPVGFKRGKIEVFEIWCEETNKVYWINRHADDLLGEEDDLYKLDDFYPCPKPLLATHTTNKFIPRSDYTMAQDQYEELDILNDRIASLTEALRVVGVYDKTNTELSKLLSGPELNMVAVDNWAAFSEAGGLKGQVDWFPVDVIAKVLTELEQKRVSVIAQIYELTSISDIQRGASNPRETLGAQKLKAQYSSVRLQLNQQDVGKFVRQAMKIKCEMICKLMDPEQILTESAIAYTESGQKPELVAEAIKLLKDFKSQQYRIEVGEETLSLADYNAERELRTEYLTAVGQFVSQASQVMEFAPQALPYILKMVQWVTSAFRGSADIETVLDEAISMASNIQPPNKDDGKEKELQFKAEMHKATEDARVQIAMNHENTQLEIAKMNNGTKVIVAEMQDKLDRALQANEQNMEQRMANMDAMAERAQQAHDMIQTLMTGYKEASMQDQQLQAQAQEGEAQRTHERNQQQQELVNAMKELAGNLSKKRKRTPQFDKDGNITSVIDEIDQEKMNG